LLLITLFTIN